MAIPRQDSVVPRGYLRRSANRNPNISPALYALNNSPMASLSDLTHEPHLLERNPSTNRRGSDFLVPLGPV
jgi:hypothetical protein